MKATGPSSSASSNASAMITQAPSGGGAPLQVDIARSSSMSPVLNSQGQQLSSDASNMMYGQQGLPPVASNVPSAPMAEASEWKGVYDPATDSYIDDSSMLLEFMNNNPDLLNDPESEKTYNELGYSSEDFNKAKNRFLSERKQVGGFVDAANMDPNTLAKFIYGGDEYVYGGDVLPKAYDGYITNFQKQMNATKNRIDQMGSKNPVDVNPFAGNAFGKATTGIQPSGTVGNRFQPSGQPNTGTTTQDGTGTTTNTNQTKTTTTTNQGQPQFDPNTMAQFQQYMQMMQGQPGMGQGQFSVGRPQRLGFGLSRDFNYSSGFSPVNWQVPEGTKGVKQTSYKDRGKWYNPFDTKRITEWRIDNGEAPAAPGATTTTGDGSKTGTEGSTGTNVNPKGEPGTTERGWGAEELDTRKERRRARKMDKWMDEIDNQRAIDKQMDEDAANEAIEDDSKAPTRGASQIPLKSSIQAPETIQSQSESAVSSSNPFTGNAFSGNQFGSAGTGVQPSGDLKFAQSPNNFTMSGQSNVSSNKFAGNAFGTANTGISGNMQNTNLEEEDVQSGIPYNTSGPMSEGMNQGFAYGGYVPEYMAYGGYIPMAKPGIVVDKAEFSDPNLIGRTVEQSAYTFKPGQLATDLFSGPTSLTGLTTNILNARDEGKKMNQAAQRSRTSDAATANTGQSGFGSAERKGSDLMASGNETQYGSTPGKQGYEGGLYGKKGGSMNTQYAKGKVYSLTMDQIKAIEAAGGKVEYIK
jgi:hypothetical protein